MSPSKLEGNTYFVFTCLTELSPCISRATRLWNQFETWRNSLRDRGLLESCAEISGPACFGLSNRYRSFSFRVLLSASCRIFCFLFLLSFCTPLSALRTCICLLKLRSVCFGLILPFHSSNLDLQCLRFTFAFRRSLSIICFLLLGWFLCLLPAAALTVSRHKDNTQFDGHRVYLKGITIQQPSSLSPQWTAKWMPEEALIK